MFNFSAQAIGTTGSDTVTVSGSGFTAGDYVTLWVRLDGIGNSFSAIPSGFTRVTSVNSQNANIGDNQQLFVFSGVYVSGNFSFTVAGGNGTTPSCIAIANSGRLTSLPTVFTPTSSDGGSSPVSIPLAGITASAGDDILWCGCINAGTASGTWVTTAPSGYTSRQEASTNATLVDAGTSCVCTLDAASAGATGTLTGSSANAGISGDRFGLVLSLAAAAAGSTAPIAWIT